MRAWFSDQGLNLGPPAVKAPSPNHWTAREFPGAFSFRLEIENSELGIFINLPCFCPLPLLSTYFVSFCEKKSRHARAYPGIVTISMSFDFPNM